MYNILERSIDAVQKTEIDSFKQGELENKNDIISLYKANITNSKVLLNKSVDLRHNKEKSSRDRLINQPKLETRKI